MKWRWALALALAVLPAVAMRAQTLFGIETCPAPDASHEMNVSWAADTLLGESYVRFTEATDTAWLHARVARPQQRRCATFDSISSKLPQGTDVVERWIFDKCGATLTGLKPNTEYMYRVMGVAEVSDLYRFTTAGAESWSACVVSDFHHYTPLPGRLKAAVGVVNTVLARHPSTSWILHLGDVTAWGGSYSFWQTLYGVPLFKKHMWAGVNGNHDNMSRGYAKTTNEFFRDANHYPRNGYEGEMGVCYHFRYGDALFVMLNSESMRTDEGLAKAQAWFEEVMQQERGSARYVVVCEHYQWFFGTDGKSSQYDRWKTLFDKYGVDLALAGNNHIYVRTNALFAGRETDGSRGTVYVQTPSADNERGQSAKEWVHNTDIIKKIWTEGPATVGALWLDVNAQRMAVTLYNREGTAIDTVAIPAKSR